jgi:hypothetical protein
LDLRRFHDTAVELFSVSTAREVLGRLASLRSILSSLEASGSTLFSSDARTLRVGIDTVTSRLNPNAPVEEAFRMILEAAELLGPASDRIVAQGLSECGGSNNPVLSTEDGIKSVTGTP